jgi:hypothetical protein
MSGILLLWQVMAKRTNQRARPAGSSPSPAGSTESGGADGLDPRLGAAWTIDRLPRHDLHMSSFESRKGAARTLKVALTCINMDDPRVDGGIVLKAPEAGLASPMQTTSSYEECAPATLNIVAPSCPLSTPTPSRAFH